MLTFWLGMYYGCVLGFLTAITWRHWESLYEPRAYIHEEKDGRYRMTGGELHYGLGRRGPEKGEV